MKKGLIISLTFFSCIFLAGCNKKDTKKKEDQKQEEIQEKKITIIDEDSNTRPIAITLNNYPSAVKVQTGLADAYMIYEIPVEGGMSRSLALFKDKLPSKFGTVRSARHNFIDYAMENDAILAHFGWSHYAKDEILGRKIDYVDGNSSDPSPFWRENPENLAREHTAYGDLNKVKARAQEKGYRMTTDQKANLNYSVDNIDLTKKEDNTVANDIVIPYSGSYKVNFKYNQEDNRYYRYVNGVAHTDYFTKEHFSTKNIIVVRISYSYTSDNYYLDLHNTGTGEGYYITNGYSVPITWQKDTRDSKTIYKYKDGNEIEVNDGNTYIMIQSSSMATTIQ